MCIIAVQPPKARISEEKIRTCWKHNNQGCGIMWASQGKLQGFRCMSLEPILEMYLHQRGLPENEEAPFVLHFRIRTHGSLTIDNCQPFLSKGGDIGLMHNGVMSDISPKDNEGKSDSYWFTRRVIDSLPDNFMSMPPILELIGYYVMGSWSKIVLLNKDGEFVIFGEARGEKDNGIWYSNGGFKDYAASVGYPRPVVVDCDICREKNKYCRTTKSGNNVCWSCEDRARNAGTPFEFKNRLP